MIGRRAATFAFVASARSVQIRIVRHTVEETDAHPSRAWCLLVYDAGRVGVQHRMRVKVGSGLTETDIWYHARLFQTAKRHLA